MIGLSIWPRSCKPVDNFCFTSPLLDMLWKCYFRKACVHIICCLDCSSVRISNPGGDWAVRSSGIKLHIRVCCVYFHGGAEIKIKINLFFLCARRYLLKFTHTFRTNKKGLKKENTAWLISSSDRHLRIAGARLKQPFEDNNSVCVSRHLIYRGCHLYLSPKTSFKTRPSFSAKKIWNTAVKYYNN